MRSKIDELLDLDEARRLKEYLDRSHGNHSKNWIQEVELPIDPMDMGLRGYPTGGGVDNYLLYKEKHYDLPFKISGFFDIRDCNHKVDPGFNFVRVSTDWI